MLCTALAALLMAPDATPLDAKVVGASLFKNGYAVVFRESTLPETGEATLKSPPVASLGALWIGATPGVKIHGVVCTNQLTQGEREAATVDELLSANVGHVVTLYSRDVDEADQRKLTGKLVSASGPMVIVENAAGRTMVPKGAIVRLAASGAELTFKVPQTTSERVLKIKYDAPKGGKVYTVSLQRGLTWAPAYQVDISDEKKLTVTAKATILNDLAPLENVELRLITGFPNVAYLNQLDPLTSGQDVNSFVQALMGAGFNAMPQAGVLTQNVLRRESYGGMGGPGADVFAPFDTSNLPGVQSEDLFLYRQPGVTLKPGDRGYYVLLQLESAYEHIYTCEIADSQIGPQPRDVRPGVPQSTLDVWHTLKFKNTGKQPLTTAPAVTVQNGEILGQDTLSYISVGSDAYLRITKALDVRAESDEEETARERGALRISGSPAYDLVTLKGTVQITSMKPKEIKMKVSRTLTGEVIEAGNEGKVVKTAKGLRSVNVSSAINWTPTLKPGATLKLTYSYKVYVPTGGY